MTNMLAYLRAGVNEYGLPGTTVLKNRPHWYRPERQDSPEC